MVKSNKQQSCPGFWIGRVCIIISLFVLVPLGTYLPLRGSLPSTESQVEVAAAEQSELSSAQSVDVNSNHETTTSKTSQVFGQQGESRYDAVSTLNSATRNLANSTGTAVRSETEEDLQLMRTLLLKPSTRPPKFYGYNPKGNKKPYPSQSGQDHWADMYLGQRSNLFVVESGAFDGEEGSNSLFFEFRRNSSCLLVEANPVLQRAIKGKHRKCHLLLGGLSTTGSVGSFMFKLVGGLGGLVDFLGKDAHTAGRVSAHSDGKRGSPRSGEKVKVSCFPLTSVMEEIGHRVVDYWSLDTEGSEAEILRHTDFSKIEVGLISVEHNRLEKNRMEIKRVLWQKGFWRVAEIDQDDMYANPCYFVKRQLHFPYPGVGFPPPSSTWRGGQKFHIDKQDLTDFQSHIVNPLAVLDQVRANASKEDAWVDAMLGKRAGLFFIQSGMRKLSSLTWFATERKWDCVVVVGSDLSDVAIQLTTQHCYSLRGTLSLSKQSTIGIYPVHLILRGMNREVVDYLFLNSGVDTLSIIEKSLDFSQTEIGLLSVDDANLRSKVKGAMEHNGFKQVRSIRTRDFYANPCYFMKRNLSFPTGKEMP